MVKLSARGISAIRLLPKDGLEDASQCALKVALAVYTDVEAGRCEQPKFVHRILPFASSCSPFDEDGLKKCAARLAPLAAPELRAASEPSFGIAFNNRKTGEVETGETGVETGVEAAAVAKNMPPVRDVVIPVVAAAFSAALEATQGIAVGVNLKSPAVVVCVEVLLVSRHLFFVLAVLPQRMCMLKPRLGIKKLQQSKRPAPSQHKGGRE